MALSTYILGCFFPGNVVLSPQIYHQRYDCSHNFWYELPLCCSALLEVQLSIIGYHFVCFRLVTFTFSFFLTASPIVYRAFPFHSWLALRCGRSIDYSCHSIDTLTLYSFHRFFGITFISTRSATTHSMRHINLNVV